VETVPPLASGVSAEPAYVDAVVSWSTSEPADSSVQFGESPLLGRTAYLSSLVTEHEVTLQGLHPDRLYYFQVVSRDNAGNTVVDDNGGNFYTLRTLVPLNPPWTDDLESGSGDWQVEPVEESEKDWQYGIPQNGVAAHSGNHVWASNLNGENIGFVESVLISPPIYLAAGSIASIRFWQNFDFTETDDVIIHLGEFAIITNTSMPAITLATFEDEASGDWEEAEYDLTPYTGNLVYFVWHYALFSIENTPEPGWTIDDISVTSSSILRITNNLAQAAFTVTGPTNFTGHGQSYINAVAPPGDYSITYGAVPYYATPAPQSGTLSDGGSIVFTGNYTFTDANNNGISDAWEQAYFGAVSPTRTATTDTDGDGMSDLAEFIVGTNPGSTSSVFRAESVSTNNVIRFSWPDTGRSYRVHAGSSLANPSGWPPVADWQSSNSFSVPVSSGLKFFRVEVKP
jgi:hypothetical protein